MLRRLWLTTALSAILVATVAGPSRAASVPPPPTGTAYFGAASEDDLAGLTRFEADARRAVGLFEYYRDWTSDFDAAEADAVRRRGAIPVVTWEPWVSSGGTQQPAYTLDRIAAGDFDTYIDRWAQAARTWGRPLLLRFAHEMNGSWYPWAEGVNGNGPGDYVRAWRHVYDRFAAAGARNVSWNWAPNVVYPGSTPLPALYPGDAYVDWVGVDGYNFGAMQPLPGWQPFTQLFDPTLKQLSSLSRRPILINETASTELGGDKASWVRDFFARLASDRRVRGFIWFNFDKETDWRIESSPAAQAAFAAGVADPRYRRPGS